MVLVWLVVAVQAGLIGYFLVVDPARARQQTPLVPIFVGFFLLALALTYWWLSRRRWINYVASHGETTEGQVESLGVMDTRGGNIPFVRFTYTVAGKTYRGKYSYDARQITYGEGQSVSVRFDPRKPKRALPGR